MIKEKGDFYLPKSRSRSKDISPPPDEFNQYKSGFSNIFDSKNEEDAKAYSSNEIMINEHMEESKAISS
jgi:hypothetical protein